MATIADRAALEVLLAKLSADIDECRRGDRLSADAQAYLVGAGTVVSLYLNEAARQCLTTLSGLALVKSPPPDESRARALIEHA